MQNQVLMLICLITTLIFFNAVKDIFYNMFFIKIITIKCYQINFQESIFFPYV